MEKSYSKSSFCIEGSESPPSGDGSNHSQVGRFKPRPDAYTNQVEFWFMCLASAIGFGNIWRFPSLMYKNGGGVFLVPLAVGVVVFVLPFYYFEIAFGQVMSRAMHRYFDFGPGKSRYQSVSFGVGILLLYTIILYIGIMAWGFKFLLFSFQSPLPWAISEEQEIDGKFWDEDYFRHDFLNVSSNIFEFGDYSLWMAISVLSCAFFTWASTFNGIDTSKFVVYLIIPLPYLILLVLLVKGVFLEGSSTGWKFIFSCNWEKLFTLSIWRDAAGQAIFSSSIGFNLTIHFASYNPKKQEIFKPAVVLPCMNFLTSLFAAVTLFSYIGHASVKSGIPISEMPIEGEELAFVVYPAILNTLPLPQLWSFLFFLMLGVIGVATLFTNFDTGATILYGFLTRYPWFKLSKKYVSFTLLLFIILVGLAVFSSQAGYFWLKLFDHYGLSLTLVTGVFVQVAVFVFVLPLEKLEGEMERNGERYSRFFKVTLKYITPWLVLFLAGAGVVNEVINPPEKLFWEQVIGLGLLLFPTVTTAYLWIKDPWKYEYQKEAQGTLLGE